MNPYLPLWEYIPNGEPRIFGEWLYVFGSHDYAGGWHGYCPGDRVDKRKLDVYTLRTDTDVCIWDEANPTNPEWSVYYIK